MGQSNIALHMRWWLTCWPRDSPNNGSVFYENSTTERLRTEPWVMSSVRIALMTLDFMVTIMHYSYNIAPHFMIVLSSRDSLFMPCSWFRCASYYNKLSCCWLADLNRNCFCGERKCEKYPKNKWNWLLSGGGIIKALKSTDYNSHMMWDVISDIPKTYISW